MKVLNDILWSGNLKIYQNDNAFKFSIDSVLLAKFVTINKKTKQILDIGTGNAPIPLILSLRTNANITGVEMQKESYELAIESIKYNNLENRIKIINGNIKEMNLENNYYDTIVCNPPYFKSNSLISNNNNKALARSEISLSLEDIFKISKKILKNRGNIAIINRPERLADIICLMRKYSIEPKIIQFVYPKVNKDANHVLIEGTFNGNSGLKLLKPLFVHNEDDTYTDKIINIYK